MDASAIVNGTSKRLALVLTALAPLVPQILGSAFNIWYNAVIIQPMLTPIGLTGRFLATIVVYNVIVFPVGIWLWLKRVHYFSKPFHLLRRGGTIEPESLAVLRRRLIHLPWYAAAISGLAWFLCIPVFLFSLLQVHGSLPTQLLWHLPISFCISGFISVTHTIFLVEIASHWGLFPVFFSGVRADLVPDVVTLSLRGRGILWAISASLCPIGSLLLLAFAPQTPGVSSAWFAVFVGTIGIAFGLCTAVMISGLVARPIDQLRTAAESVSRGKLDISVPVSRPDEFGLLLGEFNNMIRGLKEKEKLRQTFGLHVGQRAAEQILKRDPGLSGVEEQITVMFVDIRSSTAQAAAMNPADVVEMLNDFFGATVRVVEEHGGMVNKYLGDGFMALFGAGDPDTQHADAAVTAGINILRALASLNESWEKQGRASIRIGIGLHTGPAIVGSIGSPERLEFTAIGDTVNVASRIESLTKTVGRPLLLTAAVQASLSIDFPLESLPPQQVRGVSEPVKVYACRTS
ncbi:MAG: adenylate/guanylate cyclase domain-containing protein [Chthoniobacterales bacterium]